MITYPITEAPNHLTANLLSTFRDIGATGVSKYNVDIENNNVISNVVVTVQRNTLGLIQRITITFRSADPKAKSVYYSISPDDFDDFQEFKEWIEFVFTLASPYLQKQILNKA